MNLTQVAEKYKQRIAKKEIAIQGSNSITSNDMLKKILENAAKSLSIFGLEDDFKSYLQQETGLSDEDILIEMDKLDDLGVFNGKDAQTIQAEINCAIEEGEKKNEADALDETLSTIFEDEMMIKSLDIDGNGELDDEEKMQYLDTIASIDGNGGDLSLKDVLVSISGLAEGKSLDEILTEAAIDSVAPDGEEALESASTPLSKQNTHSSNYTGPSGELVSYEKEDELNAINEKIAAANEQIIAKNNEKAQIKAADAQYVEMINNLNDTTSKISNCESTIASLESDLHSTEYDIIAIDAELNNLHDPEIFTEQQEDIDALRAQLTEQKEALEKTKVEKTRELEEQKQNLETLNTEKSTLEDEISAYENEHPDSEIDKINEDIKSLEETIAQYESDKKEIQSNLNTQRESELEDAEVYGKMQAYRESELVKFMMDYATDPETKEYYDKWYFEKFNGKAYCAVFTSNVVEIMYAKAAEKLGLSSDDLKTMMAGSGDANSTSQGLTGTQFAMTSDTWGRKVQAALDNAGIDVQATIDISKMTEQEKKDAVREGKIYPGMVFTYTRANGGYHTGFIESINKDLSWNTIEGNTAVRYDDGSYEIHTVGAHTGDALRSDLHYVCDSTTKVLYWLKKLGYSEETVNALIYGTY